MNVLLRELFPELYDRTLQKGDYGVINVKSFFEKTRFLLSSKLKSTSDTKSRPIIVVDSSKEKAKFIATSTFFLIRKGERPKVSLKDCKFIKEREDCLGIHPKKNVYLFAKRAKVSKKLRFFYTIEQKTARELIEEGKLKLCGKCKDETLNEILQKIEKYGDVL